MKESEWNVNGAAALSSRLISFVLLSLHLEGSCVKLNKV
jgi:hypothetical protein